MPISKIGWNFPTAQRIKIANKTRAISQKKNLKIFFITLDINNKKFAIF